MAGLGGKEVGVGVWAKVKTVHSSSGRRGRRGERRGEMGRGRREEKMERWGGEWRVKGERE